MKVHIAKPRVQAICLDRITNELIRHAPDYVEFIDSLEGADLVVMHVAGRWRRVSWDVEQCEKRGQRHAIIQYSQRDTQRPHTYDWLAIWKHATVVWSYLDLNGYLRETGRHKPMHQLYHAPLGVDSSVFYPRDVEKEYIICTSGKLYTTESVREAILAARNLGLRVAHLGPDMHAGNTDSFSGLTDDELATLYSKCHFVAGLRRREGFELPAAEGLLCGARPIVFNRPHYQWYRGFAEFIEERGREDAARDIECIFRAGARPVTERERTKAALRFHWPNLVHGFWRRACDGVHE